jgi:hypothetical protein
MSDAIEARVQVIAQTAAQAAVFGHPEIFRLQNEIARLTQMVEQMKKCCICVKMGMPPDKDAEFTG